MNWQKNNQGNTLGMFLWGAAIGAGAVMLSDAASRDRLRKKLNAMLEAGDDAKGKIQDKLAEGREKVKEKVVRELDKAKGKVAGGGR